MDYSDLSICVPGYNEREAVANTLKRLKRSFPQAEILFVDDGSTDNTLAEAHAVDGVIVLAHDRNIGYGAAIKTAMAITAAGVAAVPLHFMNWRIDTSFHSHKTYRATPSRPPRAGGVHSTLSIATPHVAYASSFHPFG